MVWVLLFNKDGHGGWFGVRPFVRRQYNEVRDEMLFLDANDNVVDRVWPFNHTRPDGRNSGHNFRPAKRREP